MLPPSPDAGELGVESVLPQARNNAPEAGQLAHRRVEQTWRKRVALHLGPIGSLRPLGGTGGASWRATLEGGEVVVKTGEGVIDEAEGLRHLAACDGAPPVPEVLLADEEVLVTRYVAAGRRTSAAEEELGRSLGVLHGAPWPAWGGGSRFIGLCRIDASHHSNAADFYTARLLELAGRCGLSEQVERVTGRLVELLPPSGPALLHGDLWWGNVIWGDDGRAWLIDPSAHGGHPEEDLAMLALFGPVPDRLLAAYSEVRPLGPGWQQRIELFQLYPLLVHTVLFGGGYRAQAESIASRYGGPAAHR